METGKVRCGMAQLYVEGGRPDRNLARAERLVGAAAEAGCRVVVLPECCDLGWTHPSAKEMAEPIPGGGRYERLAAAAREHRIHIAAGLVEGDRERCYNSAVLIDPRGALVAKSRKINVLDISQPYYAIGDLLAVGHAGFGPVGLDVCADNFESALSIGDVLCRMGARIILSPCSWAADAEGVEGFEYDLEFWLRPYGRLARHYGIGIVGVSNVGLLEAGPWAGRQVVGSSVAVGPDGSVIGRCRTGWDEGAEEMLAVDVPVREPDKAGTAVVGLFAGSGG